MRFRYAMVWTIAAVGLGGSAQGATLYGARAAGATGELYTLDPASGAMVQDIGPLNDVSGANYPMTGLAFDPGNGVLYGSTGNSVASAEAKLVTINPATGLVTVIGSFNAGPTNSTGKPATMTDIAFDSAGHLYGVGSIGGPQLYSINPATGQATVIGGTGLTSTSGGGLAISSAGMIYGVPGPSNFGTYDLNTGAFTTIGDPTEPAGGGAWGALAFNGGTLYGLNIGTGANPPTHLAIIDPATAGVTDVGVSVNSLDAIAFTIPEPGSIALLWAGAGLLLTRRRRW